MAISQAAADLWLHQNVLREWVEDVKAHGSKAFQSRGIQRPDDADVARLRRELAKIKTERDIKKKP
jgi:transposase